MAFTGAPRRLSKFVLCCLVLGIYFFLKTFVIVTNTSRNKSYDMEFSSFSTLVYDSSSTSSYSLRAIIQEKKKVTEKPTEIGTLFNNKAVFNHSCQHLLDLPFWVKKACKDNTANPTTKSALPEAPPHNPNQLCETKFTCGDILIGSNKEVYGIVKDFMKHHQKPLASDSDLERDWKNCTRLKENGYWSKSTDTEDYSIAFNLIVHKDAHQVEQLLRSIYRPQHAYCVHVDSKSDPSFQRALKNLIGCFENVWLSTKSESVAWGGYSRLQADINCMEDLVKSKIKLKYLINTAGQAFPLKTPEEMVRVLKIYNGANDIEGIYGGRVLRSRFEQEWMENKHTVVKTGKKNPPPPHNIDIVRGSAYGIFSRNFVKFILEDEKAIALRNWSKSTWSPDELYWATLHHTYSNPHLRTPGGFNGEPNKKPWLAVYANWYPSSCKGQVVRGVCVFGVEDLPHLLERKEFFANKFYSTFQPLALDCMEAWIKHKEQCPVEFEESYYRKLPFINQDQT